MTQLELSAFLAIAKYGTISDAAEMLYISQPALSRRLRSLENELGYTLFDRRQGKKGLSLTIEGKEFISIAENWLTMWKDASNIHKKVYAPEFTVILNSSMGQHVPYALNDFIRNNYNIKFKYHVYHSLEAYQWVEYGRADFALVSKTIHSSVVHTIPAYREKMYFLSRNIYENIGNIHVRQLNVSDELLVPWCPEFQDWHDFWFGSAASPKVFGDNANVMEHFWNNESKWWSVVPASFACKLACIPGVSVLPLSDSPEDLIIYYLSKSGEKSPYANDFLSCMVKRACEIEGIISCVGA